MITLTAAMISATGRTITEPGLFVQLGFSTVLRLTDRSSRTWNSLSWTNHDIVVSDFKAENGIIQKCTLSVLDHDNAIAALLLTENAPDLAVKIWYFDVAAVAAADPVVLFDGLMDAPDGGDNRRVKIPCSLSNKMLPVGLLSQLLPAYMFAQEGKPVRWGAGTIIPQRRGEYR